MTQQQQKKSEKPTTIKPKNPATEEILNEYDILTREQINEATKKAKDALIRFRRELSRYGMLEFVNIKSVRFYDEPIHQHHVE